MKRKQTKANDMKAIAKSNPTKGKAGAAKAAPAPSRDNRVRIRVTLSGDALAAYEALMSKGIDPSAAVSEALAEFSKAQKPRAKSFSRKVGA